MTKKISSNTEKYQDHIPWSFAYKVVYIYDNFSKLVALYRRKMQSIHLLKQFLKKNENHKNLIKNILIKIWSCHKKMKKDFN